MFHIHKSYLFLVFSSYILVYAFHGGPAKEFGVRVSENLCMDRNVVVQTTATVYRMLGGSHCDRLGDTLAAMEKTVVKLTQSGWRPTKQNVENMVEKLGGR